jgi:hypothetical protein
MSKTYEDYLEDIVAMMAEEGWEYELAVCLDLADCWLADPQFRRVAEQRFAHSGSFEGLGTTLREWVAHSI